jgi:hypothetical protein
MRWQDFRTRWDELDDRRRTRLVVMMRKRLGVADRAADIAIEGWASAAVLDVELEEVEEDLAGEPIGEVARHPGRDDVHEQREEDQEAEGILHWPPHIGRTGGSPGTPR